MGEWVEVKCKKCGALLVEEWRDEVAEALVIEIGECYECGVKDGEEDVDCSDYYSEGYEAGWAARKESKNDDE